MFRFLLLTLMFGGPLPTRVAYHASTDTLGAPPEAPAPFDLVTQVPDANGLPMNPLWGWQTTHPGDLADPAVCGQQPWLAPCTTQTTWVDANTFKCPTGLLGGHANWAPASYSGTVVWNGHSSPGTDDDYNLDLYRPDHAGLTAASERSAALGGAPVLHMEFDSDETIDHFISPWWSNFHQAVDNSDAAARVMVDGKFGIALGLFGLDYAHGGPTELHPVFALALQAQNNLSDDVWAIFVRNWGNEGYCSNGTEALNTQKITLLLPRANATDVQVLSDTFYFGPNDMSQANKALVSGPTVALVPQQGALVTFTLPGPQAGARINGVLHLVWQTRVLPRARIAIPPWLNERALRPDEIMRTEAARPAALDTAARAMAERDPEAMAKAQWTQLTPRQRTVYEALAPASPRAQDRSRVRARLVGQVQRLPQPPVPPRAARLNNPRRDAHDRREIEAMRRAAASPP